MVDKIAPYQGLNHNGTTIGIYKANNGQGLPQHNHDYSHITICREGSCIVRREGESDIVLTKNKQVNLVAYNWHEIEALEDGTVFVNMFFN